MARQIPRAGTPFFGRQQTLSDIRELLGEHRLVTLTGTGGIGKTRLAMQVAGETDAGKVGWVEFASLEDARLVGATACSVLGIRTTPGVAPLESLVNDFRSKRWLLVLDNCEHVTAAVAELVAGLIERCETLRVLVTSREPLGLSEEISRTLDPLDVPDPDTAPDKLMPLADESPSVRLFLDRARTVGTALELSFENLQSIVRLCRRLEGIPLALELAAARTNVLSTDQIVARLDTGLDLLRHRTGHRVPSRHRTMRATVEWSHDLLSDPERILFRRLGVFGDYTDIEACEAICGGGEVARADVLDLLDGLVAKSLLVVEKDADGARYRFLDPVRRFAREQLETSGEADRVRQRHTAFYLERVRRLEPDIHGPNRAAAVETFRRNHDNLRAAWDYAVASGDDRSVAAMALALFWFWQFDGHFGEARMRASEALETLAPSGEPGAVLEYVAGTMAWIQSDLDLAGERLSACVAQCEREGHEGLLGLGLRELAGVYLMREAFAEAARLYDRSQACLRDAGKDWDRALSLVLLADAREALGEPDVTADLRREARALFRQTRDPWGLSLISFGMGVSTARAGVYDDARVYARETLSLQGADADDWNTGQVRTLLGEVELLDGHPERAAEHLQEGIRAFRGVGDTASVAHVLKSLAECERRRGHTMRAVRLFTAGQSLAEAREGAYPYALVTERDREETVAALRESMDAGAFAEESAAGRSLDFEHAVDCALAEPVERVSLADAGDPSAALRVFALGGSVAYRGQRRLQPSDWTFAQPRELLFYLLVNGPQTKEQIGLEFWPDASASQLRGRFRTALYQLRRALGGNEWVVYRNGRYEFNRSLDCWFDVEAFEARLDEADRSNDESVRLDCLQRALDIYRGEFLEGDSPLPWADEYRDRLQRRYFDALLALGQLHMERGEHGTAAALLRKAVTCERLSERAHRALASSLAAGGDRTGALKSLDDFTNHLRRELAVEPSAETRALRARLEDGT